MVNFEYRRYATRSGVYEPWNPEWQRSVDSSLMIEGSHCRRIPHGSRDGSSALRVNSMPLHTLYKNWASSTSRPCVMRYSSSSNQPLSVIWQPFRHFTRSPDAHLSAWCSAYLAKRAVPIDTSFLPVL